MLKQKAALLFLALFALTCAVPPLQSRTGEQIFYLTNQAMLCDCPPYGFYIKGKQLPPLNKQKPGTVFKVVGTVLPGTDTCEAGHQHYTLRIRDYHQVKKHPGINNKHGLLKKDD